MAATAISMRRCRVSYVAIHAAAGLAGIEVPATFVSLLRSGGQVAGQSVGLPFEVLPAGTTVEFDFWGTVVERPLTATPTADQAERYRRTGVPLRSRAMSATPPTAPLVTRPRVEILFNPTTVTCVVTADLAWPNGVDAVTAQHALDTVEKTPINAAVGAQALTSPLADLATTVCDAVLASLTAAPPVRMPRRRFLSVIDGDVGLSTPYCRRPDRFTRSSTCWPAGRRVRSVPSRTLWCRAGRAPDSCGRRRC